MLSKLHKTLIVSALCVAASSCGNRVETHLAFPPVTDLQAVAEPAYPAEALTDPNIEAAWWNDVLLWGRNHHDKVSRICKWSKDLGHEVPADWCD